MLTSENNDEVLQSYKSMMKLLFSHYNIENVNYTEEARNEEEVEERIWRSGAGWLGWSAYAAIEYMLERIPPGKVPLFPSAARNTSKLGTITARDFLRFSIARMLELFPEVAETKALKQNLQEPPVISGPPELGLDSEQMLNMRRYWSCFIFSLQLYLDIRNIMDYRLKTPANDCRSPQERPLRT
ncbi:uncharacterized protein LY79DRAFT_670830 [Colletotrichum navitas]|uniref:Uncharacterized protein n=1 Tax=Colletotrichum navitas TaxID=681940 RepID=A0AAD8PY06_9PEZI|nr:uncharacterized protein LY79DRAFT_670830 [Colletotrichum navitas]KAK1585828.1 hypothetical protein LY79DRAFT_670830 [Colletotrichum navitas]